MQKCSMDSPVKHRYWKDTLIKRKGMHGVITILCLLAISLMLASCGSGGSEGISSQTVSGVASVGAPLAGQVALRDAANPNREKTTMIASDGSFAIDVTDLKAPFILRASGSANGAQHVLYSFAGHAGTANLNPFSSAAVATAAEIDDPAQAYDHPDQATLDKIRSRLPETISELQGRLKPLLSLYNADREDPVRGKYKANHEGLDGVFDNVRITLSHGVLTITNVTTGAVIFTGKVSDIKGGHFTDNDDDLPKPPGLPDDPDDVTATGGAGQVTVKWDAVKAATSYNIYWSTTVGVTKANGTKITGVTSPYVHTGLAAGTKYYYIVTAVNSAGEGSSSEQASATVSGTAPPASIPAAPTGVSATGGTKQVTVSWSPVTGATSYNLYWSASSGVTTTTGTKISGVTSPSVHTGLADGTTYYYIITAVNSAGEGIPSAEASATTMTPSPSTTAPTAPTGVGATGGTKLVTVSWSGVSGATSYNLYWAATSGVTVATGTKIAGVTSPYDHTGRADSTAYYYIVTAVNDIGESAASAEVTATTDAPAPTAPAAPTGVSATGGAKQVSISWSAVTGATSYNLYWATTSGVTTATGTKIAGVTSPYDHTGRADGTAYYYIVTAVNSGGESAASAEVTATTDTPAPTTPALCVSCHGTPPATGRHAFHFPSKTDTCVTCHGAGYDPYGAVAALPSTHMNGVINIASGNPPGWNATARTCTNICHGSKSW